jgi:hypothetical protein
MFWSFSKSLAEIAVNVPKRVVRLGPRNDARLRGSRLKIATRAFNSWVSSADGGSIERNSIQGYSRNDELPQRHMGLDRVKTVLKILHTSSLTRLLFRVAVQRSLEVGISIAPGKHVAYFACMVCRERCVSIAKVLTPLPNSQFRNSWKSPVNYLKV